MSKNENEMPRLFILPLIIAVILFISIAELPYGFYTVMRIIVPLLSAIYLFFSYMLKDKFDLMLIPNILIVILWNPILPIYMDKETWVVVDAIAGISQILMTFYTYHLINSINYEATEEKKYISDKDSVTQNFKNPLSSSKTVDNTLTELYHHILIECKGEEKFKEKYGAELNTNIKKLIFKTKGQDKIILEDMNLEDLETLNRILAIINELCQS